MTIEQTVDQWLASFEDSVSVLFRVLGGLWFVALECLEEVFLAFLPGEESTVLVPKPANGTFLGFQRTASILEFLAALFALQDKVAEITLLPGTITPSASSSFIAARNLEDQDIHSQKFYTPEQTYLESFESPISFQSSTPATPFFDAKPSLDPIPSSSRNPLSVHIRPIILENRASLDALQFQTLANERAELGLPRVLDTSSSLSFVGRPVGDGKLFITAYKFEVDADIAISAEWALNNIGATTPVEDSQNMTCTSVSSSPMLNASAKSFVPSRLFHRRFAPAIRTSAISTTPPLPLVQLQPRGSKAIPIVPPAIVSPTTCESSELKSKMQWQECTLPPQKRILMERSNLQDLPLVGFSHKTGKGKLNAKGKGKYNILGPAKKVSKGKGTATQNRTAFGNWNRAGAWYSDAKLPLYHGTRKMQDENARIV
ncbi:hypothetical protein DL96DRAFT_1582837 [Flagelloscypha sp. PMI_526]|nr:hypothetical protein DL96DRAFT_1582837 [Flagelloscypha sp. PMI_526]